MVDAAISDIFVLSDRVMPFSFKMRPRVGIVTMTGNCEHGFKVLHLLE
jgi:hypothetical protein